MSYKPSRHHAAALAARAERGKAQARLAARQGRRGQPPRPPVPPVPPVPEAAAMRHPGSGMITVIYPDEGDQPDGTTGDQGQPQHDDGGRA